MWQKGVKWWGCFSLIHELDIIQWLFALPLDVYASMGAPSNLGIEAEDNDCSIQVREY